MKSLAEWTEADLKELIGTNEGQSIDFKRSDSIDLTDRKDTKVKELAKDVSAMANAAGGRIYYGVVEDGNGKADRLDDGLDPATVNIDQIGNLLTSNIEPSVPGVTTHAIPLASGWVAIAIDIPQSMNLAPHQSRLDRVYHRRHDRKTLAMFDHEIRDVMRRSSSPEIVPHVKITRNTLDTYKFQLFVENRSSAAAVYYVIDIGLPLEATTNMAFDLYVFAGEAMSRGIPMNTYQRLCMPPQAIPIFKPRSYEVASFVLRVGQGITYPFTITFSCPDFHGEWNGVFVPQGPNAAIAIESAGVS
jgi:hypothetical protein